tara:strand:+ start:447 stop:584 length:138 start_codon:yes stop_codon:yes gene_type:complete
MDVKKYVVRTTLRYKTADGYTGSIVRVLRRDSEELKYLKKKSEKV